MRGKKVSGRRQRAGVKFKTDHALIILFSLMSSEHKFYYYLIFYVAIVYSQVHRLPGNVNKCQVMSG